MPRTLARLKWKVPQPPKPLNPAKLNLSHPERVQQRIRSHVVRHSKPARLNLQVAVNPKAKPLPTGQSTPRPWKPRTLKDLVDPQGKARHGQIIYIFRNTKTNQIIYSLSELLDKHHLDQLPFIGRHSKPPVLRPDEWIPHCVVTFPTPEQGHNAFRKLREFRKLHELSWDKTNPEWIKLDSEDRMKKIMDQLANTSADLAEVLRLQGEQGIWMQENLEEHERRANELMDKKWPEIDALVNAAAAKERPGDNVKWLENQIKSLTWKLQMKHNQNEADQQRLQKAKRSHEVRINKILYAQRKAEQFKKIQEELNKEATLAYEEGAQERLDKLQEEVRVLQEELANSSPGRTGEQIALDKDILRGHQREIAALKKAFVARAKAEARDHYIARSILPAQLRKTLPQPFTLEGVSVMWADLVHAEYATGNWPSVVSHEQLSLTQARNEVQYLGSEQFEEIIEPEVRHMIARVEAQQRGESLENWDAKYLAETDPPVEEEKKGVWKYLPDIKNPFKRAEA